MWDTRGSPWTERPHDSSSRTQSKSVLHRAECPPLLAKRTALISGAGERPNPAPMKRLFRFISATALAGALNAAATGGKASQLDVIIVGSGISGLCAGLEAARGGASVTVVDMASVFGGHAVMSTGMLCLVDTPEQRASHVVDSAKLAGRDFLRLGEDADADWVWKYAQSSRRQVYDWLHDLGVRDWELYPLVIPGNSVRRQHVAKGRGVGLVSPIYRECLRYPNLAFRWNTKVTGLIIESGRVAGVRIAHQRSGQTNELRAGFVVLATGGFESNLELVRAFWPHYFPGLTSGTRVLMGSGLNSLGSGLGLASNAGGSLKQLDHQLFYSTGLVDPRDPSGQRGLHAFNPDAIWVNAQANRFVWDGAPDPKTQMPAVLRQSPATYWAIFDATSRARFFVSGSDWNDTNVVQGEIFANPKLAPWIKRADSLEALAQAAGLPPSNLAETVRHWNEMIAQGNDLAFHRFGPAGLKRPPRIDQPPFFAVQFFPLSRKSLGGVAVDLTCQVLDTNRRRIPGLYAVGELTGVGGINGRAALEGTMLGPSIFMGRVAAKDILGKIKRPLARVSPQIVPEPASAVRVSAAADLRDWREVLRQLVAQPRRGYLHFEKAHAQVLARNYDCAQCHGEASPLALTEDQLDRRAMIGACPSCHGGVKE
jgi:predicted oxidoreductase